MLNVLAILTCTAQENDIEAQMTQNSEMKNLKALKSTRETQKIHQQYNEEQDLIRNEMKELGDRTSDEYLDLSAELRDSQTEEDEKVKKIEEEAKGYEEKIDLENDQLESQIQSIQADKEGFQKGVDDFTQTFNYFGN